MLNILEVNDLEVTFSGDGGKQVSVDQVSFHVEPGEILCIVGESGCGKSVTSLALMGLLGKGGHVTGGQAFFEGENLLAMSEKDLDQIRGNRIAMIFQDPLTSLNPVFTIGNQITESIRIHMGAGKEEARERARDLLERVGLSPTASVMKKYPHLLSGGMRQRVMIAMALSCSPSLLIADEPTTALDVTIQAQIMDLILKLRRELGMAVLLITHDMGLVAQTADRVMVMYGGRIVEEAPVFELFDHPSHPYTRALLQSVPSMEDPEGRRLAAIGGMVPERYDRIEGCRFFDRCPYAKEECKKPQKELMVGESHMVRCCRGKEAVSDGGERKNPSA